MKVLAFYLPQFHPIPENDQWWGRGFTEWTNVVRVKPMFRGHHQPKLPADLGFYDLRVPETRINQAKLAREHGIHGFCYYHYWFQGKMLLERPFNEVLESKEPDFPFCLCWANEHWCRNWSGGFEQILMEQKHSEEDDAAHIQWLMNAFRDSRYIRVDDKPLVLIYKVDLIPHIEKTVKLWKDMVREEGFPGLYLVAMRGNSAVRSPEEMISLGFDGVVEFQPNSRFFPHRNFLQKLCNKVKRNLNALAGHIKGDDNFYPFYVRDIYNYEKYVEKCIEGLPKDGKIFPTVIPGWDNTPRRRGGARIIQNDDHRLYGYWLRKAMESVRGFDADEQIVFINAWNEWAEGCILEPDRRNGRKFLEATRAAVREMS